MSARLEAALRELVACKDLKERLHQLHEMGHGTDYGIYHRRQPLAWAEARAALAEKAQPVQEPVAKITAITPTGGAVEWLLHQGEPIDLGQELYTAPPQPVPLSPLTAQQLDALIEAYVGGVELADGEYSSMVMFAAAVERAHGIGGQQ